MKTNAVQTKRIEVGTAFIASAVKMNTRWLLHRPRKYASTGSAPHVGRDKYGPYDLSKNAESLTVDRAKEHSSANRSTKTA
jgi:hypothetical protein